MNLLYFRTFIALMLFLYANPIWAAEDLVFLSTQLAPAKEARVMREKVLDKFPHPVRFLPVDDRSFFFGLASRKELIPGIVGGLHGEFVRLAQTEYLLSLDSVLTAQETRGLNKQFLKLGQMNGKQIFVPWLQATYIMVANKRALRHLPPGADINRLTYDQLLVWARAMKKATGAAKLGFPAGRDGLMHRFLQGYLYPSFTGGTVRTFRSKEAIDMWIWFRELWRETITHSMTYRSMAEPLLTGEVWLAWDHTARLAEALERQPEDFIAFPAPAGAKGRGFMIVLAGLGMPRESARRDDGKALIKYLIGSEAQATIMANTGFFPVISNPAKGQLSAGLRNASTAVNRQAEAPDALPALLPVGLGNRSKEFNNTYKSAFGQIVLRGREPSGVLKSLGARLQKIIVEVSAPCWPPDAPSQGACPVK